MEKDFKQIALKLYNAQNILLYPHVGIDGDAVGSCAALACVLRKLGKKVFALYKDDLPENLAFMFFDKNGESFFTDDPDIISDDDLDISMAVDCGGYDRFKDFRDKFDKANTTLCVDHHGTSVMTEADGTIHGIADISYIDPNAAACGELIYELLIEIEKLAGVDLLKDPLVANAIFAAITTDTGNFQYSNTSANTHLVVSRLYDLGLEANKVSVEIYESEREEALKIRSLAMNRMEMVGNGRAAITYVSKSEMESIGVKAGETDAIVNMMRVVKPIEYVAFLKEKEENVIRVSFRAKAQGNVARIAQKYNGGGHIKAAGCTLYMPLMDAVDVIRKEFEEVSKEL